MLQTTKNENQKEDGSQLIIKFLLYHYLSKVVEGIRFYLNFLVYHQEEHYPNCWQTFPLIAGLINTFLII